MIDRLAILPAEAGCGGPCAEGLDLEGRTGRLAEGRNERPGDLLAHLPQGLGEAGDEAPVAADGTLRHQGLAVADGAALHAAGEANRAPIPQANALGIADAIPSAAPGRGAFRPNPTMTDSPAAVTDPLLRGDADRGWPTTDAILARAPGRAAAPADGTRP